MDKIERFNSAIFKANFSELSELVKRENRSFIIQKNNKDHVAIVPLSLLEKSTKKVSK